MNYNWNWRIFWEESPDGVHTYWETLVDGLQWTLAASLCGWIMALVLGVLIGTARTLPPTRTGIVLRRLGSAYIEPVSYTHLRAHETVLDLVCRLLLEKKKT